MNKWISIASKFQKEFERKQTHVYLNDRDGLAEKFVNGETEGSNRMWAFPNFSTWKAPVYASNVNRCFESILVMIATVDWVSTEFGATKSVRLAHWN